MRVAAKRGHWLVYHHDRDRRTRPSRRPCPWWMGRRRQAPTVTSEPARSWASWAGSTGPGGCYSDVILWLAKGGGRRGELGGRFVLVPSPARFDGLTMLLGHVATPSQKGATVIHWGQISPREE